MNNEQKNYNRLKLDESQSQYQNQYYSSEYAEPYVTPVDSSVRRQEALSKSFIFMAIALFISAAAAWYTVESGLYFTMFDEMTPFWLLIGVEFALVIGTNACVHRQMTGLAIVLFLGYSIVNGMTLSTILLVYTQESIFSVFAIAAGMFVALAAFGALTKKDLTGVGQVGFMLLIGLIILGIVNFFVKSSLLYNGITILGLTVFIGLTAYDTQKIIKLADGTQMSTGSIGVYGALELYLDFINLFLYLLRLLGKRD